ncbi:hypothetical protein ACU686_17625 [Yinghuangia aomiensis]
MCSRTGGEARRDRRSRRGGRAEAEDVASAVAVVHEQLPDVVLLDVHLPGGGGVRGAQASAPTCRRGPPVPRAVGVRRRRRRDRRDPRARGYVTKSTTGDELVRARSAGSPKAARGVLAVGSPGSCWTRSRPPTCRRSTRTSTG